MAGNRRALDFKGDQGKKTLIFLQKKQYLFALRATRLKGWGLAKIP